MGFKRLLGIDRSAAQCEIAHRILPVGVPVIRASFESLPLRTGSVGILTSRFAHHYCEDASAAVSEAGRVLCAGGLFMDVVNNGTYDAGRPEKLNGDGTITQTLFDRRMQICYPLHKLTDYFTPLFCSLFDLLEAQPLASDCLDGVPSGEKPSYIFFARRNARPFSLKPS
jgi:ubiquinone/menaquinone biosynthesis C-methylase UbiE